QPSLTWAQPSHGLKVWSHHSIFVASPMINLFLKERCDRPQSSTRHLDVVGISFNPDIIALMTQRHDACSSGTVEWIKDRVADARAGEDTRLDEIRRKGREVSFWERSSCNRPY